MGFGPRDVAGLLEGQKCTSPTERCPQMLSAAVSHEAAPVRRLAQVISMAPCCGLPCRSHVDAAPEALAQYLPPLSSRGRPRPQGRRIKRAGGDPRGSPGPAADAGRAPHPPVQAAFGTPAGAHQGVSPAPAVAGPDSAVLWAPYYFKTHPPVACTPR